VLQSLAVTLREGVEAALVIGIIVAYLNKSGRRERLRLVYAALATAVAASIVAAVAVSAIHIDTERYEGWLLLLAAFFVGTMVIWMQRAARGIRRSIEQRLETIAYQNGGSAAALFLFVFFMVFREGVETVLLLGAVSLNTSDLLDFFGAVVGLTLAVVFGVLFVRGTVRLDLRRFFQVTGVILFCVVFQLLITGLHELSENGFLPSSRTEMALIGPIVSNQVFFFVAILALAALMVLLDWRSRQGAAPQPAPASAAERRKAAYAARREKLWAAAVCTTAFVFILFVTAEYLYARNQTALSPATQLAAFNDEVRIPLVAVSDGDLHRFLYSGPRGSTRFIVVQAGGKIHAAVDACLICGTQGYYQKGSNIFCRNCSATVYAPSIGSPGGCNPVPLAFLVEDDNLVIRVNDLESHSALFSKPKD